jgi:hypothetical protein
MIKIQELALASPTPAQTGMSPIDEKGRRPGRPDALAY